MSSYDQMVKQVEAYYRAQGCTCRPMETVPAFHPIGRFVPTAYHRDYCWLVQQIPDGWCSA